MIGSPVARQQPHDLFVAFLAARIAQPGQLLRIPFPGHDRAHDRHTRGAAQIGDRLMDSHVHLVQALLQPPDPVGWFSHQRGLASDQAPELADLFAGPVAALQQPII
jgi:hypothetical protein